MELSFVGKLTRLVFLFLFFAIAAQLEAQVVSSGINGIVRDASNKPVSGVTVTAVHEPTGTTYHATTRSDGTYAFRSLIVGGPYSVTAEGQNFSVVSRTGIVTELGTDIDVNFGPNSPGASEVVSLEKMTIAAASNELDSGMTGAGGVLTRSQIDVVPTVQRSFADVVKNNPLVTLRLLSGDRQEAQLTAVGMNNRYNSFQLDGARINDQFGLNGTGLASFFNPISLDTIEQLSVSISPYDVRQSGFTGASVNAVTKSGTNEFHGTAYDLYSNATLGDKDQVGANAGKKPPFQRRTYGFTFGGPLIKNKLYFFTNYEKFVQIGAPSQTGLVPDATQLATIAAQFNQIDSAAGKNYTWGDFSTVSSNRAQEIKRLAKLDWNITSDQRLSVRFSDDKGSVPQFGKFTTTSTFTGVLGSAGPSASVGTALTSNFYAQERKEQVIASELFSQWTPDFKTEIRYSRTKQDQLTPTNSTLPEVRIFGITGVNQNGATVNNGVLVGGTEQFRQGNTIHVKTDSYSATGDYFWQKFIFSGGFDREKSSFYNLFRAGSYGLVDYSSIATFLADTPAAFSRSYYASGTPAADVSDFGITGIFGQAKWNLTPRLSIIGGARVDFVQSSRSAYNPDFNKAFGIRNDGAVDGTQMVSPRLSFNYAVEEVRLTQIRGGVGYFVGRAPWVFFSNSYSNSGVGRYLDLSLPNGGLSGYLKNGFDVANPIGVAASDPGFPATPTPAFRRDINLMNDKLKLPSVWRGNIAIDRKLAFLDSTVSVELVQSYQDKALFSDNLALQLAGYGADGRPIFRQLAFVAGGGTVDIPIGGTAAVVAPGNIGTTSNTRDLNFNNVIRVRNVTSGDSTYATLSWDRPMKNRWAFNASYTRGRATEAQSTGQTVATDGWTRNAVFYQNSVEIARSDFEVKNRFQATISREFVFVKNWKTTASLYYEGHTGSPYSFVYSNDLNRDNVSGNDLIYVPKGPGNDDTVVDYSKMTSAQITSMMNFINGSELNKYKGTYTPRNAFYQQWQNRLDLHLSQDIPIYKPVRAEIFLDFINFGTWIDHRLFNYTEVLSTAQNGVYYRRLMGNATYGSDGRIQPTYTSDPGDAVIDNLQSRWRVQIGAKIAF